MQGRGWRLGDGEMSQETGVTISGEDCASLEEGRDRGSETDRGQGWTGVGLTQALETGWRLARFSEIDQREEEECGKMTSSSGRTECEVG